MLARFRKISLFMAYAVATIPLWHYTSEAHILLLMLAVIIFAYLNIVLSSFETAQTILSSEKAKTPLPRWLPKKAKYEKWWLIVRHTLKWHLLLVPAKMGLALGLTQWLNTAENYWFTYLLKPYVHHGSPELFLPQWETFPISLAILTVFSTLNASFFAAIFVSKRGRWLHIVKSILTTKLAFIGVSTIFDSLGLYPMRAALPAVIYNLRDIFIPASYTFTEQGVLLTTNILDPTEYSAEPTELYIQYLALILAVLLHLLVILVMFYSAADENEKSLNRNIK